MSDRDMYIQKAMAKLDSLKAEIDRIEAETQKLSADAEIKRREALKLVRQRQAAVEERIKHLQNASELAWDDVRAGFEAAWNDLTDAFKGAHERYSTTGAPS